MEVINDPDILLVKRIQAESSRESFEILYDKYSKKVFNFCLNFLGDEEDAKDCTQEIFIKVFRSINGFRFGASFYTWLYRLMINSCNDMRRKNKKIEVQQHSDQISNIRSHGDSLDTVLTAKQAMEAFHSALKFMSANARTILILRDVEGRSYEEISSIIKCKPGTVRSRLARARMSMAERLKDFRDEM